VLRGKPSGKKRGAPSGNSTELSGLAASDPLGRYIHQLLQEQGQPKGMLTPTNDSAGEIKFRWSVVLSVPPSQSRPCNTAHVWRPSQAEHKINGAWVSVTHHGEVNLICLHPGPQCLHRGSSNRRLLGYVPLSLLRQSSDMEEVDDPVTSRPSWKGAQQKCSQRARHVTRSGSLESIGSPDSPHTADEPAQLQQADYSHDKQCSPNRSDIPNDRQQQLSRE
jgi:hypothetical protein